MEYDKKPTFNFKKFLLFSRKLTEIQGKVKGGENLFNLGKYQN